VCWVALDVYVSTKVLHADEGAGHLLYRWDGNIKVLHFGAFSWPGNNIKVFEIHAVRSW
jgi:hypothetical protein